MDKVWNLVADIGGTNARFSAMVDGQLESKFQYFIRWKNILNLKI